MKFAKYGYYLGRISHTHPASRLPCVTVPRMIYSTVHSRGPSLLHCLKRPDMTRVRLTELVRALSRLGGLLTTV